MPDTPETFEEYANRAIADRTEELRRLHERLDALTADVEALPQYDSEDVISRADVLALLRGEPRRCEHGAVRGEPCVPCSEVSLRRYPPSGRDALPDSREEPR